MRRDGRRRSAAEQDKVIVEALREAGQPLSAYDIIGRVRDEVTLAPQTVYRALDRLIASGAAHRLESLNAFVACAHEIHAGAALFAICESCNGVTEFDDRDAVASLSGWAVKHRFAVRVMTLELRGLYKACAEAA